MSDTTNIQTQEPERRVFYIDVGDKTPEETSELLKEIVEKVKDGQQVLNG